MPRSHLLFLVSLAAIASPTGSSHSTTFDTTPYIGVLTAPSTAAVGQDWVADSYVQWLSSAGAVAVPIPSGVQWDKSRPNWVTEPNPNAWTQERYDDVFSSINGLLLPGGNPWPYVSSPQVRRLLDLAKAANARGDFFPVFGTCAGMEALVIIEEGGCQARVADGNIPGGACGAFGPIVRGFSSSNLSLPLDLTSEAAGSSLLGNATSPESIRAWLQDAEDPVTFNHHSGGVTPAFFAASSSLTRAFRILSTNRDRNGSAFVSTLEARGGLPFFGVQWHPEKILFEHGASRAGDGRWAYEAINHGPRAVAVSQYFANFFVGQARKSRHRFEAGPGAAMAASIYAFAPSQYNPQSPMYTRAFHIDWGNSSKR